LKGALAMIGFRPNETDRTESDYKSYESAKGFDKGEVTPEKPDREIILPTPSFIPTPEPDTIVNSPSPEITSIPADIPATNSPLEVSPIVPMEFH